MKRLSLSLLLLFLPFTSYSFWPIFWDFQKERHFFGPFFSYSRDEKGFHLTVRPLFSTIDDSELRIFYPLCKISESESYFIPFFLSKKNERERYWNLFLFYEGSSEKGRYGGFFPFFGNAYDNFGKEEIRFVFWPLYSFVSKDGKETINFLWPFFSIYRGMEKGKKIWPIYGVREGLEEKRSFFLWPLFFREEKNLGEDRERTLFFFPFYLKKESMEIKDLHLFWPLFNYQKTADKDILNLFWPFFSYKRGRELLGYKIFPIFSYEEKEKDRSFSLLWPLYKEESYFLKEGRFRERRFMLLSKVESYKDKKSVSIWPFFDFYEDGSEMEFYLPFILPIKDKTLRRILNPLLTLLEIKKGKDGSSLNLLYGLFTKEKGEDFAKTRFSFLFTYERIRGSSSFEILYGLLKFEDKRLKKVFFLNRGDT